MLLVRFNSFGPKILPYTQKLAHENTAITFHQKVVSNAEF